jgi:hypothetical protein
MTGGCPELFARSPVAANDPANNAADAVDALLRSKNAHTSDARAITPRGTPIPAPIAVLWHEPLVVHDVESESAPAVAVFVVVESLGQEDVSVVFTASRVEMLASIA